MRSYVTLKHNPTTITAPTYGVFGSVGATWTVVNESKVGYYGIQLRSGGTVINDKHASILAVYNPTFPHAAGVLIRGGFGNVANLGILAGYWGVLLYGGGYVFNYGAKALIEGSSQRPGVEIKGSSGTVINSGTITGGSSGVYLETQTGRVTNYGQISGRYSVFLKGGGTVVNAGTGALIDGSSANYGSGVDIKGGLGFVRNLGAITGPDHSGRHSIELSAGGTVINGGTGATRASISGSGVGVIIGGGRGTVTNFATISGDYPGGGSVGVELQKGGRVVNGAGGATRASISSKSYTGVSIGGGRGTVTNFATINGSSYGVDLQNGGKVVNGAIGAPRALINAVKIDGGPASVTNFGTISSSGALQANGGVFIADATGTVRNFGNINSVYLRAGGIIVNGSSKATSAFIRSTSFEGTAGTVTNFGTIGVVELGQNSRLIVEPGAKFIGDGFADGKDDTIELAAKSSGSLQLGTRFFGFDKVVVDRGANWRVDLGLKDLKATTIAGNGSNVLALRDAGTVDLSRVRGFPTISLSGAGANRLTLASSNFVGITGKAITVQGGSAADILSETGVSGLDKAVLNGGGGADTLIAGRNAVLTGGGAKDVFELTVAGSPAAAVHVTIADFTHGWDKLALSEKGFGLGAKPTAATSFTSNATGRFTNSSQRFAYNTANGALFFDGRGNAAGSTRLEIAMFSKHPTLTASDITFLA